MDGRHTLKQMYRLNKAFTHTNRQTNGIEEKSILIFPSFPPKKSVHNNKIHKR